jgi:hypothetical protein
MRRETAGDGRPFSAGDHRQVLRQGLDTDNVVEAPVNAIAQEHVDFGTQSGAPLGPHQQGQTGRGRIVEPSLVATVLAVPASPTDELAELRLPPLVSSIPILDRHK